MTTQAHERMRDELTVSVEETRASYHRLKAAGSGVTGAEISQARASYEQALGRLRQYFWSRPETRSRHLPLS